MKSFETQTMEGFMKEAYSVLNNGGKIVCFGAQSIYPAPPKMVRAVRLQRVRMRRYSI